MDPDEQRARQARGRLPRISNVCYRPVDADSGTDTERRLDRAFNIIFDIVLKAREK
jgi:hypothetical protein